MLYSESSRRKCLEFIKIKTQNWSQIKSWQFGRSPARSAAFFGQLGAASRVREVTGTGSLVWELVWGATAVQHRIWVCSTKRSQLCLLPLSEATRNVTVLKKACRSHTECIEMLIEKIYGHSRWGRTPWVAQRGPGRSWASWLVE